MPPSRKKPPPAPEPHTFTTSPDPKSVTQFRRALLAWYRKNRRDLPWRPQPGAHLDTVNPYHVLVSEAMLQQTQVATVVAYFNRFINALPTIQSLAQAKEQQVLRLWQGLGYYRRAKNLHAAAKIIAQQHLGNVPDNLDDLLKLPGVGRYTAAAVASIAFGRQHGVLDGNVARVLARLTAITQPTNTPAAQKTLWALTDNLAPARNPGDFNQALMELGATTCTPKNPTCTICPVSKLCTAREQNLTDQIPAKSPKRPPVEVNHHIVAIKRRGQYLFRERPPTGLWSGMWELPTAEKLINTKPSNIRNWVHKHIGLEITQPTLTHQFTHRTTHRLVQFTLWHAQAKPAPLRPNTGRWKSLKNLDDLPMANPQRQAVSQLSQLSMQTSS